MPEFTPVSALVGGALIGLAASLFLLAEGRVCGISGLFGGLLRRSPEALRVRVPFLAGLLVGGVALRLVAPGVFDRVASPSLAFVIPAGLLVGFGTQLGNGCTSGHGVCGLSRLSIRSLVATCTFMAAGFVTVFVVRHVLGVTP